MLKLDISTLSFIAVISSLVLAAGLHLVTRIVAGDPSLRLWTAGAYVNWTAYVLLAARHTIPDLFSIVAANTLLIVGFSLTFLGNRRFRGYQPVFPWYWVLSAVCAALFAYFTYLQPSVSARIVTVSVALAAVLTASAIVLLWPGDRHDRSVRWFVGGSLLANALLLGVRAAVTPFTVFPTQDFPWVDSPVQNLAIVFGIAINVVLGIGLPLLVTGRTQRQLTESEARFRQLFEVESDAVFLLDADSGQLLEANPAAEAMYGYSRAELLSRRAADLSAEPERTRAAIKQDRSFVEQRRHRRKDGSEFPVEISARNFIIDGHKMHVATIRDITQRLAAEAALRESEQKLRGLYELSPLGIALADMQGQLIEFNESFRKMCGYSREEMLALDIAALTPEKYAAEDAKQIGLLKSTGYCGPYEKERLRKDGSVVPIRLNGMLITGHDGQKYIWAIVEDISDSKAAELAMLRERTRLETILRTASDGIHIIDADGLLVEANDAFLQMLGHDRSVVGRLRVGDWDAQDNWDAIRERHHAMMESRETRLFETLHKRKDGKVINVEISACAIELEGRRFIYGSSRDVTERKLEQKQLRDLNANLEAHVQRRTDELARANQELEAFSYSVSHDLRAPLRAIGGFANIVNEREAARVSEEGRRMLARISAGAGKMGDLIDDILQFARMGRVEMKLGDVDMAELARDAARELSGDYPRSEVSIGSMPRVTGDATMLQQVWANLLGNALKFSAKTERPQVTAGMEDANGAPAFFVRDNGVGFDAQNAKLFEVFQRFHPEQDFPGTGAGLAIVKRIVERHGGRVWAESRPGAGAVFYFTLAA